MIYLVLLAPMIMIPLGGGMGCGWLFFARRPAGIWEP